MEKKNCKDMSNVEIKLYMKSLNEEFEAKKSLINKICDEMDKIEDAYHSAEQELSIRTNLYL